MYILVNRFLVPSGFVGITLFPIVVVRDKRLLEDSTFLRHEKIHFVQQRELLIMFFFIWYVMEFFVRFIQVRNYKKAYRSISFEREAYENESDEIYLSSRRMWSFIKYL